MKTKIVTAAILGTIAFKNGIPRVPAFDKNLKPLLHGNRVGEGIPVLKAWLCSWDAANLNHQTKGKK